MGSLKAAVIGCGGHAQLHLRMIDKEPRLRLVGVAEIDATRREQAQAEWRVEGFADYREFGGSTLLPESWWRESQFGKLDLL